MNTPKSKFSDLFDQTSKSVCVIAEIGLNHNGDINLAKKLIDIAAIAGCDIAKFQKRDVKNLAVKETLDAPDARFPTFGSTYRQIREHLEFNFNEYKELKAYVENRGMQFLCTAFDVESTDFLMELGVEGFKLASHSLTNWPLLDYISKTEKPCILSTGMCTFEEIDKAVGIFKANNCPLTLLHCVSAYPTPIEQSNLAMIGVLRSRYPLPIGYSGHEIGWLPTLAAVSMGAKCIERHITCDKNMIGFDHKISLAPDELIKMVRDIRDVEMAIGTGKKSVSETEQITRNKYHVSWASAQVIQPGTVITEDMLTLKNPGTGIPAGKINEIVGKRAKNLIDKDVLLQFAMID